MTWCFFEDTVGFRSKDIVELKDVDPKHDQYPSKKNLARSLREVFTPSAVAYTTWSQVKALKELVSEAQPGDHLVFHCTQPPYHRNHHVLTNARVSGHGSQKPDLHGDEDDGLDEGMLPLTMQSSRC